MGRGGGGGGGTAFDESEGREEVRAALLPGGVCVETLWVGGWVGWWVGGWVGGLGYCGWVKEEVKE